MNIGGRISKCLNDLGLKQIDLLERVPDLDAGALSALITRDSKRSQFSGAIAEALGVNLRWLVDGIGPQWASERAHVQGVPCAIVSHLPITEWLEPADLPDGQHVFVPRYDVHISAGNGHVVYEVLEKDQPQAFRSEWIKAKRLRSASLICVYAHGRSMEPRIADGDTLLVDRNQADVVDGKIYVLRYGDEVRIKRLFKRPDGGLIIRSDNVAEFPDVVVTAQEMEHIEIIGKVIQVSGDV